MTAKHATEVDIKLFGRWDTKGLEFTDASVQPYINVSPVIIPHTHGLWTSKRQKQRVSVVEKLANRLMRSGQGTNKLSGRYIRSRKNAGKKLLALRVMEEAFEIIENQTKQNPLNVLIRAVENAGMREDVTRLKKGGANIAISVDVSPQQRVTEAVKNISLGTLNSTFKNKKTVQKALADEIMLAAKEDQASYAIKRRNEQERIAKSAR